MELLPGSEVEGWVVEGVLGRGAMATVYGVRHRVLGLEAALKVLDRADTTLEQRLVAEGRAQASIGHPGVVGVLDHLVVQGHAALLLERVPDGDLARHLAAGRLPLDAALDLFRQVVSALAAAHAAGLVHRDLKPSNVLLRRTERGFAAKVGDFGLVKTMDGGLTATQAVVGTPRYMAPEQMRAARRVDARADVFSLGCVLYELVTGRQAFPGDDWVSLYAAKEGGRYVDPRALEPALPAPVAAAIAGCLQGSPARRIPSCATLLAVLDGKPWQPDAGDATLDLEGGLLLCPACGAPSPAADRCGACGAALSLDGRFQLLEELSSSPVTRVYRAIDLEDGAIVVARACVSTDALVRERFRRGARVSLQLEHPGIARGRCAPFEEHGRVWEVRAYVEGRSLADELAVRRFGEAEVLRVIEGLCAPLGYLAERSPPVVHRAVSPANVLRATDGRLVLVDFAQVRDGAPEGSLHDVPGSAPEQWVGEATPSTDVFGLGTLATTLLTRRPARELAHRDELRGAAIGDGLRSLLADLRAEEPTARPSIREVSRRVRALQAPAPIPPRRLSPAARTVLLAAALTPMFLSTGILLGSWTLRQQAPEPSAASRAVGPPSPERRLVPGADLAGRPLPGADCGPAFDLTVTLADPEVPATRLVAVTCDGRTSDLGPIEPGVPVTARVPGKGRVGLAWGRSLVDVDASTATLTLLGGGDSARVLEGYRPLLGAVATPARADRWTTDASGLPLLAQPRKLAADPWYPASTAQAADDGLFRGFGQAVALSVGGVHRGSNTMLDGALYTQPVAATRTLRVTTPNDRPIADAEVQCFPGLPNPDESPVQARTDAEGRARCGSSATPHRWAVADAEGFVADVTELVEGEVRVVLRPARRVLVGCVGADGEGCEVLAEPPVCVGGTGRSSGICRANGEGFVCECAPDADRIRHGVLGTVALPEGAAGAWFDRRGFEGTVSGQLEGGTPRCEVSLRTPYGGLTTRVDAGGHWHLSAVPDGAYRAVASCGSVEPIGKVRVTSRDRHPVMPTAPAPPDPRVLATRAPEPEPTGPERALEDFVFPAWPADADPATGSLSCTAEVDLGADGVPTRVEVRACPPAFAAAAETALRGWRWAAGAPSSETLLVPFDPDRR